MNPEHEEDPILDACLSEVLGGHAPPDLAARIVRPDGQLIAKTSDPVLASIPEPPPVVTRPPAIEVSADIVGKKRPRKQSDMWSIAAIVASFVGLIIVIGFTARSKTLQPQVAKAAAPGRSVTAPRVPDVAPQPSPAEELAAAPAKTEPEVEPSVPAPPPPPVVAAAPSRDKKSKPQPPQSAVTEPPLAIAQMPPLPRQSSADSAVVSFINNQFAQTWKEVGVRPTAVISDAEWCQRAFSRILGRAATADEIKGLADDKSATRREKLVRRLLTDKTYANEFASHWSAVLAQTFLGRGGNAANSPASREDLQKYFASALAANKPYSEIVTGLLTATGSPRPGADDYNPAVNFLLDGMTNDATVPTARVARVLLGHQLQCAQCHQHPSQGWSQDQFWGLDACLRQVRVERRDGAVRLVSAGRPASNSISYQTPDGQSKTATPRFIDGSELAASDNATGGNLLATLAQRIVQSDDFCRASANRVWAQLFDYGFTRPLDDFGPHSTTADAEVLDRLAGEFAGHNFDLKAIIRWAVLCDPFSRSSKVTDLASKDIPEEGEPALFSRFYSRPTRSADAFASLAQATRIRSSGSSEREMERARIDWLAQANRTSTKVAPKKAPVIDNPSIVMKGGDPIQQPASGDPSGLVKKLAASEMSFDHKAEHLFLAALGRQPTPRERRAANELLRTANGTQSIALDDLWWSLQNSSECIFDR